METEHRDNQTLVNQPAMFDSNVFLIQMENQQIIEDMEHHLRREFFNAKKGEWEKDGKIEALVNDEGIHTLLGIVRSHLDKNVHLSLFTEKQIYDVMKYLEIDIIWNIRDNWQRFNINKANVDFIIDMMMNPIFAAFKRAQEGATLNMLSNTQRIEQRYADQPKKGGLFGLRLFKT